MSGEEQNYPFLAGGGVSGQLARSVDWGKTPLGPPGAWPQSLRTMVSVILHSRHPMFLWWGPDLVQIYNDAYLPSFGAGKHPAAMGQRGRDCWPEIWPIIWPQIDDVMSGRGASWNEDHLVPIFRNGRIEEVYWTYGYSPVPDDEGGVGGVLVVCTETTARVIAERRSRALLRDLEDASRAKDEFLAMLGHELRNPLSPIATALQLMRLKGHGETTNEQEVIERQVNHLTRLVDDLLDVSKITRGKVELRKERAEVSGIIAKALEMASDMFEQRSHQIFLELGDVPLCTEGDPVRLAQVVANLLTNAARYTEPGGKIWVAASREDGEVVIRVKDNGPGIDAKLLPHVFDLFVQGKRSADRAQGGLGIGLTLVKNLVALHGGSVHACSDGPGQGSEFVIRLPAADAVPAGPPSATAVPPLPVGGTSTRRRVLIVDDNTDAADLLGELLRAEGHEVEVAYSAADALAAVKGFRPEVAVLDIGLPVMDGYELATHLRANPGTAGCRLIALTGYGQIHDRARSESSGFEHHLVKPVDIDTLTSLVDAPSRGLETEGPRASGG